jgi:glycosyltransferase involved in cell wall biosynthesis
MIKPSILITSPSIDTSINVSGIANLTRLLLVNNIKVNYRHFIVGKKDSQKRNIFWFLSQFLLVINFIKLLFTERDIKVNHINVPMSKLAIYINFILIVISKIFRKKIIVHFRGGSLSLNEDVNLFQKEIIGKIICMANRIIVLGKEEKKFLNRFYKAENIKIVALPNAVEIPKLDIKEKHSLINDDQLNIIYIGRIDKDKGLEEIVKTLRNIDDKVNFQFQIAGAGPDLEWFISRCNDEIENKFTYLGVLDHLQKKSFYKKSYIFLLPSYFEGLPNSLLEAMSFGVVPVVTPVGSIPEVVCDGENGFLVPVNDYKSISEIITKLYYDRRLLEKVGNSAFTSIMNKYSLQKYILNLNNIYSSIDKEH